MDDHVLLSNPVMSQTKFISAQWNPYLDKELGVLDRRQSFEGYYRPLSQILYDSCYSLFKHHYWQYHLLNLFLFVFAASLLCLFIEKVTGNHELAFLTGLFCLIHPINGIVVNYIVSSVLTLEVIFLLGTILLLWESLDRKNSRMLYFLSLLTAFLSLFWYDMGMLGPLYIIVVILLFRRDPFTSKILYLLPYLLISLTFLVFKTIFLNGSSFLTEIARFHMTWWEYLATVFRLIMWHLTQLVYPQSIVMQWVTPVLHEHIFWDNFGLFFLLLFALLLFVKLARAPICQLAIAWILISFAPVFLISFRRPDVGALIEPHWFILSSVGFFILAAYFCLIIMNRTKIGGGLLLFIVIVSWGMTSHAYNQLWADQKTYSRFWVRHVPNFKLPCFYLAEAYQQEGDLKDAVHYYRMALSGNSSDLEIYHNLGVIDETDHNWKEAESNYKKALKIAPLSAATYNNLGFVFLYQGQSSKAKECFIRALVYNPLMLEPRRGLADISLSHFEYQKAIDLCLKNLEILNNDTGTLLLLVDIYNQKKDFVRSKECAYRIINYETDPEVLTNLGIIMGKSGQMGIAIDCYIKAMRVAPGYKYAYLNAGTLLGNMGKYGEAIHLWRIGLSLDPSDQRFRNDIAQAVTMKLKRY